MTTIMVTGSANGLGEALMVALSKPEFNGDHNYLYGFDIKHGHDVRDPQGTYGDPPIGGVDILINCAGINRTGWFAQLGEDTWDEVMDVNSKGIFKMAQWLLPSLQANKGTIVNIVSNASHMPMTCSAAYNASKGAAHILTLQMARELTRTHGITVFGVSPNKLAGTQMSKDIEEQVVRDRGWTPEFARQYQLNALLCGEETDPARLAEFVAFLLSAKERHKYLTGCIIPYGA